MKFLEWGTHTFKEIQGTRRRRGSSNMVGTGLGFPRSLMEVTDELLSPDVQAAGQMQLERSAEEMEAGMT